MIFRHPIFVSCWVDDLTWSGVRHQNWGDELNYYLIKTIAKRPVVVYNHCWLARWLNPVNYLCVGTLLDVKGYCNAQTIVWGSGATGDNRYMIAPKSIAATRGRLTNDFCRQQGYITSGIVGDPALILPLVYVPQPHTATYELGIIPHVTDNDAPIIRELQNDSRVLIIDLEHYDRWTDVVDKICQCKRIASSSLHGLIVSDAYQIPNCWITIGHGIPSFFKFYDYATSVQRKLDIPYPLRTSDDLQAIIELCNHWQITPLDAQNLFDSCPFRAS